MLLSIKELRNLTGLSQSKFAKKYQIKLGTLQKWEIGKSETPQHYLFSMNQLLKYEGYFFEKADK